MKTVLSILSILILSSLLYAQNTYGSIKSVEPNMDSAQAARIENVVVTSLRDDYEERVESFSKMRRRGIVMTSLSAPALITGIVMIAEYDWDWHRDANLRGGWMFTQGAGGIALSFISIQTLTGGIILTSVGSRKRDEYMDKLKNLPDISFYKSSDEMALRLTFSF